MADMLNTRPLDHSQAGMDYKPISGWAVAALSVSGSYVLYVGIIAVTALYTRRPLSPTNGCLPSSGWCWRLRRVRTSSARRGTRVGLKYATMAWWLSVVGGTTFWAYNYASKIALKQQAEVAATEWFDFLKQGKNDPVKLNQAFLRTIEPTRRQNLDPSNTSELDANFGGDQLPGFRNSDLVRYFERNGEDVSVNSLGVSALEQIDTGYKLDYTFRIRSPEGIANLSVILFASEVEIRLEDGGKKMSREWHIVMPQGGLTIESSTTYGRLLQMLQDEARELAVTWVQQYSSKQSAEFYLLTLPARDRTALAAVLDAIRIAMYKIGGLPVPPLALTAIPNVTLTAEEAKSQSVVFNALYANGFFGIVGTVTEEKKNRMREAFRVGMMMRGGDSRLINLETAPQITVANQEVRDTFPVDLALGGGSGGFAGAASGGRVADTRTCRSTDRTLCKGKVQPRVVRRSPGLFDLAATGADWRVARLETTLEPLVAPKQGPGGGGPMPGGPPGGGH